MGGVRLRIQWKQFPGRAAKIMLYSRTFVHTQRWAGYREISRKIGWTATGATFFHFIFQHQQLNKLSLAEGVQKRWWLSEEFGEENGSGLKISIIATSMFLHKSCDNEWMNHLSETYVFFAQEKLSSLLVATMALSVEKIPFRSFYVARDGAVFLCTLLPVS